MKRLIPAAILLAAVFGIYFFSLQYVTEACDVAKLSVARCENEYRNGGDPEAAAAELERLWDKREGMLSLFVNHGEIDDFEYELASLSVFAKTDEEAMFYESIARLRTLLHQIKEDTAFGAHSIF